MGPGKVALARLPESVASVNGVGPVIGEPRTVKPSGPKPNGKFEVTSIAQASLEDCEDCELDDNEDEGPVVVLEDVESVFDDVNKDSDVLIVDCVFDDCDDSC